MKNYKLTIAYDGTNYNGWQKQLKGKTIQDYLEKSIAILVKHDVHVIGSGRTDAGVHALAQIAHFHNMKDIDFYLFLKSINGILPRDIRVTDICYAPMDFHARYSAKGKIYQYHLCLDRFQCPFNEKYSYHVTQDIDLVLMKEAAKLFIGTHDFTSFTNKGGASNVKIRTIKRIDFIDEKGGCYLEFEGNGFLYKMVRNIVGSLLDVAMGKKKKEDITFMLSAKDRRIAGKAAAAKGLFLAKVFY